MSSDFRISLSSDQNQLVINTKNSTLAGIHQLQVRASTLGQSYLFASFNFTLELVWTNPKSFVFLAESEDDSDDIQEEKFSGFVYEANEIDASDIVVAINRTGPLDFKLPETEGKH